mgnify:CR=1 FL=1
MIRAVLWGLAAFGMFISGLVFSVLAVGLLNGALPLPDRANEVVSITIVALGAWTAGVLCERAAGRWAALAVAITPLCVLAIGYSMMESTEGHGAGLAPSLVAMAVGGSAALVGGGAYIARRSDAEPLDLAS